MTTKGGLYKRGETYWARWTAAGKTYRVSTGEATARAAKVKLKELVAPFALASEAATIQALAHRAGEVADDGAALSVAEIGLVWGWFTSTTSRKLPRATTLKQYSFQWQRFVAWLESNHPNVDRMERVTRAVADEFIILQRRTRSANTANKYLRFLSMVWATMIKDKRTKAINHWHEIEAVDEEPNAHRDLTVAELKAVCSAATADMRNLLVVGIYSGLRLSDAATLRWAECDMDLRHAAGQGFIIRVPSKSRKRKRAVRIPMHPDLWRTLSDLPRSSEYVLPNVAAAYAKHPSHATDAIQRHFMECGIDVHAPGTGSRIVRDDAGRPVRDEKTGRVKLEVTGKRAVVEVGYHSLRHAFVSMLRSRDAAQASVSAIVGHASPAMTRHYTNVGDAGPAAAIKLLPSMLGDERPDEPAQIGPGDATGPQADPTPAEKALALLNGMTAQNWRKVRDEAIAVLNPH